MSDIPKCGICGDLCCSEAAALREQLEAEKGK